MSGCQTLSTIGTLPRQIRLTKEGPFIPDLKDLILTHMLQTEVKSKMSALKKGLQQEPAFPDGSPASRTIMGACQIATQAGDFRPRSVPIVMVAGA